MPTAEYQRPKPPRFLLFVLGFAFGYAAAFGYLLAILRLHP